MKQNNSYPQLSEIIKSRPKSFSEGYGVINQFPAYENKNEIYEEIPEPELVQEPKLKPEPNKDYLEIIYNKIIGFTFHLVLIATFELIFFNYYIIQCENNAVISLSNQLVQPILNFCNKLDNTTKIIVDSFINLFVNETVISNNALSDKNLREKNNIKLYDLSIVYYSVVISVFVFILLINCILKKKIDIVMIFIDNLIMICILGIYEYLFFQNIIFKYMTLGPNELIKNVMVNMLNTC
jgi:hypothetical protein